MTRTPLPAPLALTAVLALQGCALPGLAVEPRYGPVNLSGDLGVAATGVSADNSVEDLGLGDDDGTPGLRADFDWGSPHLVMILRKSTHDGSGTLSADIEQGGTTIPAGTDVVSDLDLGLNTFYLTVDVVPGEPELGVGLGVSLARVDWLASDTSGAATIDVDETLPLPFLAARARFPAGRVEFEGLLGFLGVTVLEQRYTYVDLDLSGRLRLFGEGHRAAGWVVLGLRYTHLDVEFDAGDDRAALDLDLSGPYLGLRLEL